MGVGLCGIFIVLVVCAKLVTGDETVFVWFVKFYDKVYIFVGILLRISYYSY